LVVKAVEGVTDLWQNAPVLGCTVGGGWKKGPRDELCSWAGKSGRRRKEVVYAANGGKGPGGQAGVCLSGREALEAGRDHSGG